MKLLRIIEKNFKIFIRSKVSALIIFLGPLLLVSLIGMSFSNSQLPGLSVGVYAPDYTDLTNSIISKIEENKFSIQKFDVKDDCINSVKKGDQGICLVFPEKMDKTNNEVSFIVDYSKMNLVWIVLDVINSRVSERATELRQSYADDLLNRVVQTKDDLTKQKTSSEGLSKKQSDAKSAVGSATSSVDEINPSTDFGSDVEVSEAQSSLSSIISKIDSAKSKIASAKSAVSGSGISEEDEDDINGELSSASSYLVGALSYLEGNKSINSIEFMITELSSALTNAKSQLETIKAKKDTIKGDLVTLDSNIADSIKSIDELTKSTNDMLSRLENVKSSDAATIVSPIKTKIEPVTTQETHFNYLFPTLIVLIIMITAVLLSSTLVMNEKKSKSVFRNFITPTSDFIFNFGTFLTAFLAILIQVAIFLLISSLFFQTDVLTSLGQSSLVLILIVSAFILLGMLIGYLFKSEETYVLAAITVCALLMFLSSTIMPIETISDSIRMIAAYTPFVVSENLLRQVMFFNFGLGSLIKELCILIAYVAVFAGIIAAMHKLAKFNFSVKRKEIKK